MLKATNYFGMSPFHFKMHARSTKSEVNALKNLNSLCDVKFILGLLCIFLLLEYVHMLIKFA